MDPLFAIWLGVILVIIIGICLLISRRGGGGGYRRNLGDRAHGDTDMSAEAARSHGTRNIQQGPGSGVGGGGNFGG